MSLKLSQVLAIEKSAKTRGEGAFTKAYHNLDKKEPLAGLSRVYTPKIDGDETLPEESTKVQITANHQIELVKLELSDLMNVVAQKDFANCSAKADVVVDGVTVATGVPVTYLLYLEKKLTDLATFVSKLPTLDPSIDWEYDSAVGAYRSEVVTTHRTKKVPRVLTKAEATKEHPAQTEVWHEDILAGFWATTRFSGAMKADDVNSLRDKVEALSKAVKVAREEANNTEAPQQDVGSAIMKFIFG